MLIEDQEIDLIDDSSSQSTFISSNLIIYSLGCLVANSDAMKLFYMLKDNIRKPTIIVLCCNVIEKYSYFNIEEIKELKQKYPNYELYITGCINELVEDKFNKLGKIVYKKDMWELKNYEK